MATGLTLAQLRSLLRLYIDDKNSDQWTDAQLLVFLNEGQKEVQKVIDDTDENFFSACQSYSVVADADSYEFALPDNSKKVILAERLQSGTLPIPAEYVEFRKRHEETGRFQPPIYFGLSSQVPRYYLRGTKIGIVNPTETYTLRLWYTYAIPDLVNDADYSEIPSEFRNLIALAAVPLTKGLRIGDSGEMPDELREVYTSGLDRLRTYIEVRQRQTPRQVNYIMEG